MANCLVSDVYGDVRGLLSDTQILGGEYFPNSYFISNPNAFGEPYRTMFARMTGGSKRVQRAVYIGVPANNTVIIPANYGIVDFSEPEMIEERPLANPVSIVSTSTTTPIICNSPGHNLGAIGGMVGGQVGGVIGTSAPWGNWFATIVDANNFSLNGSATDGTAGTGGAFYPASSQQFCETLPIDLSASGLDGQPSQTFGVYLWIDEQIQVRGATSAIQLRITYYASGTAPTNPNYVINIDNCRDFLAVATAANCARAKTWYSQADRLRNQAYGDPSHPEEPSLIDLFFNQQVLALQRGPARRQQPFRDKRTRFSTYLLG